MWSASVVCLILEEARKSLSLKADSIEWFKCKDPNALKLQLAKVGLCHRIMQCPPAFLLCIYTQIPSLPFFGKPPFAVICKLSKLWLSPDQNYKPWYNQGLHLLLLFLMKTMICTRLYLHVITNHEGKGRRKADCARGGKREGEYASPLLRHQVSS